MMGAMVKPPYLDGARPSWWTSHTEYYLASAGVQGEVAGLRAAQLFLHDKRTDWFTIALGRRHRPQAWTESEEVIGAHFNAISDGKALRVCQGYGRSPQCRGILSGSIRQARSSRNCLSVRGVDPLTGANLLRMLVF